MRKLPPEAVRALGKFLEEDIRSGDITTNALGPLEKEVVGTIFSKSRAILAGVLEVIAISEMCSLSNEILMFEGNWTNPGEAVLRLFGPARTILSIERVSLNILMRMSGIATETYRLIEKIRATGAKTIIAATRKTTPGFRFFEKRAVIVGGGDPHRYGLDDMILIKNNHIVLVGGVSRAIKMARKKVSFTKKISCEVRSLQEALEAVDAGADIILLDNFAPQEVKKISDTLSERGIRDKVILEASGGINEENIVQYANSGVDVISVGAITHSYRSADFNMRISLS